MPFLETTANVTRVFKKNMFAYGQ